jgi:hypothetical protein
MKIKTVAIVVLLINLFAVCAFAQYGRQQRRHTEESFPVRTDRGDVRARVVLEFNQYERRKLPFITWRQSGARDFAAARETLEVLNSFERFHNVRVNRWIYDYPRQGIWVFSVAKGNFDSSRTVQPESRQGIIAEKFPFFAAGHHAVIDGPGMEPGERLEDMREPLREIAEAFLHQYPTVVFTGPPMYDGIRHVTWINFHFR